MKRREFYLPIDWSHLKPQETQNLLAIIDKAKLIQDEASVLISFEEKRKKDVEDLISICRKCGDDECTFNDDCEVKRAYSLLYE